VGRKRDGVLISNVARIDRASMKLDRSGGTQRAPMFCSLQRPTPTAHAMSGRVSLEVAGKQRREARCSATPGVFRADPGTVVCLPTDADVTNAEQPRYAVGQLPSGTSILS
jgi:hypothetical protein